jgi:hypothetical protein
MQIAAYTSEISDPSNLKLRPVAVQNGAFRERLLFNPQFAILLQQWLKVFLLCK